MAASASGMLKKIFLILEFLIWSSCTSCMPIFSIRRILLCQKELSWLMWDWRSAQVSQPQSSRLATPDWNRTPPLGLG